MNPTVVSDRDRQHGLMNKHSSAPSLLFNAASMSDLLGVGKGKRKVPGEPNKKVQRGGAQNANSMSSNQIGEELIQSILREETGDDNIRMNQANNADAKRKNKRQGSVSSVASIATQGSIASLLPHQHQNMPTSAAMPPMDPLERARQARNARNNIHAFAPALGQERDINIGGDDIS